jgi:hypothetical protein
VRTWVSWYFAWWMRSCSRQMEGPVVVEVAVGDEGAKFSLDHPGAVRAWLLIVLVSVFDSHVRFPCA